MLVELEPIAAFYTRGREDCSPSHHKVLQGLNIRKLVSGRSIFESAWVVTVLTLCYKTCMGDVTAKQRCGGHFSWLNRSRHQLPLAKPHENNRGNQGRLHSMLWCWSLPSHKLWMSIWAKDKCMLTAKTKEKGWWVFSGGTEAGQRACWCGNHKTNTYFYFSLKEQSRKTVSLKQTLECWPKSDLYDPVWDFMCRDLISHCHQKGQDWPRCTCPKPPLHCHQQK